MDRAAEQYKQTGCEAGDVFAHALQSFRGDPILILPHNDADGLASAAILKIGLERAGKVATVRLVARGESPWSAEMSADLAKEVIGGIIIADLGVRDTLPRPDVPTLIIDHHVPRGYASGASLISGFGMNPTPTTSLLSFRAAMRVADVDDLLWLAALGIIGDMAEGAGFPEMAEARLRYGITALRKATALVNQPRRAPGGDASPSLALLLRANGPKAVLSGRHPETAVLEAARETVRNELAAARRAAPKVVGNVALICFASGAQVHPLVAQTWASRLRGKIVLAANKGFRPGWVHFAARSAEDVDLVAFLAERAPPAADENYGSGHRKAAGGALQLPDWNVFVRNLGFGREMEVQE